MPRSSLLSLVVGAQALFGDEPSVEVPVVNVPRYLALCWYGMEAGGGRSIQTHSSLTNSDWGCVRLDGYLHLVAGWKSCFREYNPALL